MIEERFVAPHVGAADFDSDGRPRQADVFFCSEGETSGVPPFTVGGVEDNSGIAERGLLY
ncbi:hypothetical protein [Rhodococcoides fascians]|uniref:hypothetical protein n=1 Tax=Rhodococcoides fascians TaxID=1828 RepID=UPI000AB96D86|nr:hypothetical protein [Rhodococcus fascians]